MGRGRETSLCFSLLIQTSVGVTDFVQVEKEFHRERERVETVAAQIVLVEFSEVAKLNYDDEPLSRRGQHL